MRKVLSFAAALLLVASCGGSVLPDYRENNTVHAVGTGDLELPMIPVVSDSESGTDEDISANDIITSSDPNHDDTLSGNDIITSSDPRHDDTLSGNDIYPSSQPDSRSSDSDHSDINDSSVCSLPPAPNKRDIGDIDGDGKYSVTDLSKMAAHIKGIKELSGEELYVADINGDNTLNVSDISLLAAAIKGIKPLN